MFSAGRLFADGRLAREFADNTGTTMAGNLAGAFVVAQNPQGRDDTMVAPAVVSAAPVPDAIAAIRVAGIALSRVALVGPRSRLLFGPRSRLLFGPRSRLLFGPLRRPLFGPLRGPRIAQYVVGHIADSQLHFALHLAAIGVDIAAPASEGRGCEEGDG
jgi:hypothetical protein